MALWGVLHAFDAALEPFSAELREIIEVHGGDVSGQLSAEWHIGFVRADSQPLRCAQLLLAHLQAHAASACCAFHTDSAQSLTLETAARIARCGWGGQILASESAVAALRRYAGEWVDLGLHQLSDLLSPQHLFQFTEPGAVLPHFAPLRSLSNSRHNLPVQITPFVGRAELLTQLGALLGNSTARLITLTGAGGAGKTRLALQLVADNIALFPDGVYFVALDALTALALLGFAIADALGLSLRERQNPKQQLFNHLRRKRMLLLLDGFEHLLSGGPLLLELLEAAPGIKLLVTSRAQLHLAPEIVCNVDGLAYPEVPALVEVARYDAVRLFLQSARQVDPFFVLDEENQAAVAQICQMVEGLPLALELAAAWVRMLSCQEIVEELARNRTLLESSRRDIPERHRSLSAVFRHSWRLLAPEVQDVYARLTLFPASFSADAALRIAGAPVEVLASLVAQSLLRPAGDARYILPRLLNQYAEEYLHQMPEAARRARESYISYFTDFLSVRSGDLRHARQRSARDEMAADWGNIRVMWIWAGEAMRFADLRRSVGALFYFLRMTSRFQEGYVLFAPAITAARHALGGEVAEELAGSVRALLRLLLLAQAEFARFLGGGKEAETLLNEALTLCRISGDARRDEAGVLMSLGTLAYQRGELEIALSLYYQSMALFEAVNYQDGIAELLHNLGNVAYMRGDFDGARAFYLKSLALDQAQGDAWAQGRTLTNLAHIAAMSGEYAEALTIYEQRITLAREFEDRDGQMYSLVGLWYVEYVQGNFLAAQAQAEAALGLSQEMGSSQGIASSLNNLSLVLCDLGDWEAARCRAVEAQTLYEQLENSRGIAYSHLYQGYAAEGMGDIASAERFYRSSLALLAGVTDAGGSASARQNLARLLLATQRMAEAESLLTLNLQVCRDSGNRQDLALALCDLGGLAASQQQYDQARGYFCEALHITLAIQATPVMLRLCLAIARLWRRQELTASALGLLRLVYQHPSTPRLFQQAAAAELESVPAAAVAAASPIAADADTLAIWVASLLEWCE